VSVPLVGFRRLWIQRRIPGHDPRRVVPLGDLGVLAWLAARPSFSQLPHVRLRAKDPVPAAKSEIAIRALGVTSGDDSPLARSATLILWRTIENLTPQSIVARLESAGARIIVTLARILA
jgi:hypothetical protein